MAIGSEGTCKERSGTDESSTKETRICSPISSASSSLLLLELSFAPAMVEFFFFRLFVDVRCNGAMGGNKWMDETKRNLESFDDSVRVRAATRAVANGMLTMMNALPKPSF